MRVKPGFFSVFLLALITLCAGAYFMLFSTAARAQHQDHFTPISVVLNEEQLHFDVEPRLEDDQVYLPLRKVFETMGYLIQWDDELRRITIHGRERVMVLYPESELYSINGTVKRMEQLIFVEDGRSLVNLDFLQELALADEVKWDEEEAFLQVTYTRGEIPADELLENELEDRYANFIEVRLQEEVIEQGDVFQVHVGAPFIPDIHTYEIRFSYDPELIQVQDLKNPAHRSMDEHSLQEIDDEEGQAVYTQSLLGYKEEIAARKDLVLLEGKALQAGKVPFDQEALKVVLLDNRGREIPVSKEEVSLEILPQEDQVITEGEEEPDPDPGPEEAEPEKLEGERPHYYYEDIDVEVDTHGIMLGDSESSLIELKGEPDRQEPTIYGYRWLIYRRTGSYLAVGIKGGEVVSLYAYGDQWSFGDLEKDVELDVLESQFNTADTLLLEKLSANFRLNLPALKYEKTLLTFYIDEPGGNNIVALRLEDLDVARTRIAEFYLTRSAQGDRGREDAEQIQQAEQAEERILFDLANYERLRRGLPELNWHESAALAAREHSREMYRHNYFSHTSPVTGAGPSNRLDEQGVNFQLMGENIARGQADVIEAHHGLMNSRTHREAILEPDFLSLGVGTYGECYTQKFVTEF